MDSNPLLNQLANSIERTWQASPKARTRDGKRFAASAGCAWPRQDIARMLREARWMQRESLRRGCWDVHAFYTGQVSALVSFARTLRARKKAAHNH